MRKPTPSTPLLVRYLGGPTAVVELRPPRRQAAKDAGEQVAVVAAAVEVHQQPRRPVVGL
jgi:hypothetical protein